MDDDEILAALEADLDPPMFLDEEQIVESFYGLLAGARVIGQGRALARSVSAEFPALRLGDHSDEAMEELLFILVDPATRSQHVDLIAEAVKYMNKWMKSLLVLRGLPFLAYWSPSVVDDDNWRYWVIGDYVAITEAFGSGFVSSAEGEYGFRYGFMGDDEKK